jgi:hypothetical protein
VKLIKVQKVQSSKFSNKTIRCENVEFVYKLYVSVFKWIFFPQKFQLEKSSHTREVNDTLQTAEYLLKGPQINEEEKSVIQSEMLELQHGWEELEESLTWKQNR